MTNFEVFVWFWVGLCCASILAFCGGLWYLGYQAKRKARG